MQDEGTQMRTYGTLEKDTPAFSLVLFPSLSPPPADALLELAVVSAFACADFQMKVHDIFPML